MKSDIILAGVGGQGILSIAAVLGLAAGIRNLYIKQSEIHGMSQRGGAVHAHVRISDKEIASDLIPLGKADMILSVEPMEALRYLPYLSKEGWLVTNQKPYKNIPYYPDMAEIEKSIRSIPNHILIEADTLASEIKSPRSSNMVVLGAAIPFLAFQWENYEFGIRTLFGRKGEDVVAKNLEALRKGDAFSKAYIPNSERGGRK